MKIHDSVNPMKQAWLPEHHVMGVLILRHSVRAKCKNAKIMLSSANKMLGIQNSDYLCPHTMGPN